MLKYVLIFIFGVILGAGGLYILMFGLKNPFDLQKKPTITQNQPVENLQQNNKNLEDIRSKLYQEGVIVEGAADTIFPNTGFILKDNEGNKLFIRWTKDPPQIDQNIAVKGTVQNINGQEDFRKEASFTNDLKSFLATQRIYLEAKEVNPQ